MGRKKKPIELKIVQGTTRKDRDGPKVDIASVDLEVPPPPVHLGEIAAQQWELLAAQLVAKKLLHRTDWNCLEVYCVAYEQFRQSTTAYAGKVCVTGAMGGDVKNPALTARKEAAGMMVQYGAMLGLDPSSRSSLNVGKAPDQPGDLGALLQPRRRS